MADAAPLIVLYGNHCTPLDLHVFARLKAAHPVYVLEQPQCLYLRLATGERATVFGLPFPHRAGLVGAGVAPGDVQAVATDLLDPVFMVAADALATARERGDVTLMVGHATIAGSVSGVGQPMGVHGDIVVTAGHLARIGETPKIFGHVHKPQEVHGAYYVGSICRMDFGEREEKRFLVVEYGETVNLVSHPIDVAPMHHIEGRLDREGFHFDHDDWMCQACNGSGDGPYLESEGTLPCAFCDGTGERASWAGADVRVRYRYQASEKAVINEQCIRDRFNDALRLKIEGIVVADREIRSPEVAAAKTLPEKVAAYRKVDALEPSIADKLAALEQQEPAQLLASVSAALAAIERPQEAMVAA